jgi:3-hydroxy-3-methylglutaryl CoA synthase
VNVIKRKTMSQNSARKALGEKGADWPKIGAFEVRTQNVTSAVKSSEWVGAVGKCRSREQD